MPDSCGFVDYPLPFISHERASKSLQFDNASVQSSMCVENIDVLTLEYTRLMMGFLLFQTKPESIAMIGLGGGSLAKFCYRYLPATRMTVIEINPHVIALRDEFHVPADDDRFLVIQDDGARYLRTTEEKFDVLLVDGFDDKGQPDSLCTRTFYNDCRRVLTPDGVMVANLLFYEPGYINCVERIARTFKDAVLHTGFPFDGNDVIFGFKQRWPTQQSYSTLGKPGYVSSDALRQLLPELTLILRSLLKAEG